MEEAAEPPWTPEDRAAIIAELQRQFPGRRFHPVQRGNLASVWECWADVARDKDAFFQDRESAVPLDLAALIAAVRRTRRTRFYPFMGLEYPYFADGPGVWDEKGEVGPACIGRSRPEGYLIFQGAVGYEAPGQQVIRTLTTHGPAEAERLLTGWAWSGRGS